MYERYPEYGTVKVGVPFNVMKHPDGWFWCRYNLNPYKGCEHDCIYCYARSRKYSPTNYRNFERVYVKKGIVRIFRKKLISMRSRGIPPDVILVGSACDPFQPAEDIFELSIKIIQTALTFSYPVMIATKSDRVTSIINLFENNEKAARLCTVGFTVTVNDDRKASVIEPNAPPPSARWKAMEILKEKIPQLKVGVLFMPVIPYFADTEENIERVMSEAAGIGVDFVIFDAGLTLRGNQADYFFSRFSKYYPGIGKKIADLCGYKPSFSEPDSAIGIDRNAEQPIYIFPAKYLKKVNLKIRDIARKYRVPIRIPRTVPPGRPYVNYKTAEYIKNEVYFAMLEGTGSIFGVDSRTALYLAESLENLDYPFTIFPRGGVEFLKKVTRDNFFPEIRGDDLSRAFLDFVDRLIMRFDRKSEKKNTLNGFI